MTAELRLKNIEARVAKLDASKNKDLISDILLEILELRKMNIFGCGLNVDKVCEHQRLFRDLSDAVAKNKAAIAELDTSGSRARSMNVRY